MKVICKKIEKTLIFILEWQDMVNCLDDIWRLNYIFHVWNVIGMTMNKDS